MLVIHPQKSHEQSGPMAIGGSADIVTNADSIGQAHASADGVGSSARRAARRLVTRATQWLADRAPWLIVALVGTAFAGGAAWLATGSLPAASLTIGWPLGAMAAVACVVAQQRLSLGAFAIAVWGVSFPVLAAGYFLLCERAGLFVGVMPEWSWRVGIHAALFFCVPSLMHALVMAWGSGEVRSRRLIAHLCVGMCAAMGTMAAVLSGLGGEHGAPAVQVAVWNAIVLGGIVIMMRFPSEEM